MKLVTLPLSVEAMALIDVAVHEAAGSTAHTLEITRRFESIERQAEEGSETRAAGRRLATLDKLIDLFQREGAQMYVSFLVSDDEVVEGAEL